MKTFVPKQKAGNERKWYLIDAKDVVLGKVAVEAARIIQGKNSTDFIDFIDVGDNLVIINADKIKLTGNKLEGKKYYTHSQYIGHLKTVTAGEMLEKTPTRLLELAVYGMVAKNKLRSDRMKRLKLFIGTDHGHEAQQPELITL
ncbi:50S ribosomal protein L13 [Candidatus Peregrinibacteria bacterium]|nr:MAG: 50S ribosomal protein L13 [Candidatus Peregrinibacteria bacterium]